MIILTKCLICKALKHQVKQKAKACLKGEKLRFHCDDDDDDDVEFYASS